MRLLAGLLFLAMCAQVHAATLFGVVTERAAPGAIEAAQRHLARHPQDRIVLRSPAQLMAASDSQLQAWVSNADSVLAVAIFGDPARRLKEVLARHGGNRPLLAINGESSLNLMTRGLAGFPAETLRQLALEAPPATALAAAAAHPPAQRWLDARRLWQAGGADNTAALFAHLLDARTALQEPRPQPTLRLRVGERELSDEQAWGGAARLGLTDAPAVVVLDLANMEGTTPAALCRQIVARGLPCVQVLPRWGGASKGALERLPELVAPARPAALVILQDFVVGAAEGREAVTDAFKKLDIPVFKAIRLTDRNVLEWRLSTEGLPADSVQYRVALPELQAIGQPIVVSAPGDATRDPLTGIDTRATVILQAETERLAGRVARWTALRSKANRDKRVGIV